jgi:dimeric dUTPase (all-alpha-NTP-PPase superfamily)
MWSNMKATQEILDNRVIEQHDLDMEELFFERILALTDEVMEYAKTTKCFKYWSLKDPDPVQVRLEEFVDGIHFYLHFFNSFEIGPDEIKAAEGSAPSTFGMTKKELITNHITRALQGLMLLHDPLQGDEERRKILLMSFADFWAAGKHDDFERKEIETAYYLKNQKNHQRQNDGY